MCRTLPIVFMLMPSLLLNVVTLADEFDITKPGDTIIGFPNDEAWTSLEAPPFAIDDNIQTTYLNYKGSYQPVGFRITPSISQTIVVGLTFTVVIDFPDRVPIAFELYGSNESIDGLYELIASGDIVDFAQEGDWPRFIKNETEISFENDVAYNHYQILFTAIRGPDRTSGMQIAEVELLGFSLTAHSPSPVDGARNIALDTKLTWVSGKDAIMHDVYFGTDEAAVAASDPSTFKGKIMVTSFDPGPLELNTTYYWRIDEFAMGVTNPGKVWIFTTPQTIQDLINSKLRWETVVIPGGVYPTGGVIDLKSHTIEVSESVRLESYNITGEGSLQVSEHAVLTLDDCIVTGHLTGPGTINISAGRKLTLSETANLTISRFVCNGSLSVTGVASISNTDMYVANAVFESGATVSENTIHVGVLPPGLLRLEDNANFIDNTIYANSDGYLHLDPLTFKGEVAGNSIHIIIESDPDYLDTNLLELRGLDLHGPTAGSGVYPESNVPSFDLTSWTIDSLTVEDGASVVLVNRFDYQDPEVSGPNEVLYVKKLVLGEGANLDVGFNVVYYDSETSELDPTATVTTSWFLGCPLATINFSDSIEFANTVEYNYYLPEELPHVIRTEDDTMQMNNFVADSNQVFFARAKAEFPRIMSSETPETGRVKTILVRFRYRFEKDVAGAMLVVYLSDDPNLLEHHENPDLATHYLEIGRISTPRPPRPGSADSSDFAIFEAVVSTEGLDLSKGAWVELELVEPQDLGQFNRFILAGDLKESQVDVGAVVTVDELAVEVTCDSFVPLDINGSDRVNEIDFVTIISLCGFPLNGIPGYISGTKSCMEVFFCANGYMDVFDVLGYDHRLLKETLYDNCSTALLADPQESPQTQVDTLDFNVTSDSDVNLPYNRLLVLGKKYHDDNTEKIKDGLYFFDSDGAYTNYLEFQSDVDRCNMRLVQGPDAQLYRVCLDEGVVQLGSPGNVVVPVGVVNYHDEPRYGADANVYIGIQPEDAELLGRPVLDAAFNGNYVYVVPVMIEPLVEDSSIEFKPEPYVAAAKLALRTDENDPRYPYEVVQLYDSPYHDFTNPREIEVAGDGSVYVLNVDSTTEGDVLVKYDPNGIVPAFLKLSAPVIITYPNDPNYPEPLELGDVNDLSDPTAMYLSDSTDTLYLTSALYNPSNINVSTVYGFWEDNLSLKRTIRIGGMQHVTCITEHTDNDESRLWVIGFCMDIPEWIEGENIEPFYEPYLAKNISIEDESVEAEWIRDDCPELALPISALWRSD